MVKIIDQDIPAELYDPYVRSLGASAVWYPGSDIRTVKKRPPYRLPHMKSNSRGSPSAAQLEVRAAFLKCVECWNDSPRSGGVEPPELGWRSKEWWFAASGEQTWPDYFGEMKKTWEGEEAEPYQLKDSDGADHDANWFLKIDEQDFIDFYDEMKVKYGYPWSAKNSSDQIVVKMNQIVCNEIKYDPEGDLTVSFTPGQTAKARKGVCDDQSILHYALTWKALKEIGWTDEKINGKFGILINEREDRGHIYNWWESITGSTRIIDNTYDPGDSPKVVGGMKYWGADQSHYLVQLFNKSGHYEPIFIGNGGIYPLWYYNYFIHKTWLYFYADRVPDWCCKESVTLSQDGNVVRWEDGTGYTDPLYNNAYIHWYNNKRRIYRSYHRLNISSLAGKKVVVLRIHYPVEWGQVFQKQLLYAPSYEPWHGIQFNLCDPFTPDNISWANQPTLGKEILLYPWSEGEDEMIYYLLDFSLPVEDIQFAVDNGDTYFYISMRYKNDWAQIHDAGFTGGGDRIHGMYQSGSCIIQVGIK